MLMTDIHKPGSQCIEDFMPLGEAERHSGYTGQYLRRMAREGRIDAIKFGKVWMINRQSLEAYMARAERMQDRRFGPRDRDE